MFTRIDYISKLGKNESIYFGILKSKVCIDRILSIMKATGEISQIVWRGIVRDI